MKVLYIDGVGPFGGSSKSLSESVRQLMNLGVQPYFLVAEGTAAEVYKTFSRDVISVNGLTRFDNTQYSHYVGVRWGVLLREIFHLPYTIFGIRKSFREWGGSIDLIHVNEVTEIIPGLIAKYYFKVPLIIHVRSLQHANINSLRSKFIYIMIRKYVDSVVAIDTTTRRSLPASLCVDIIHNSFTAKRLSLPDLNLSSLIVKLRKESLKIGFVGNIQVSKGILDLLESARILKANAVDVEFLVAGGRTRNVKGVKGWLLKKLGLLQDVLDDVEKKVVDYELKDSFHLLGPVIDIQLVYEAIDVIVFPSHFDAPGRPVFEAAFSGVPSVVCIREPHNDTFVSNVTGIVADAKNPISLAAAIHFFADNKHEIKRMGEEARVLANAHFLPEKNARNLYDIYNRVVFKL